MEIKITNKNGATLKTANKYVKEDIAITLDPDLFSQGSTGGTASGFPIEVDNLPTNRGTAVPNSGYVEKVYFNTALSIEEIVSLLSQLSYDFQGMAYQVISDTNGEKALLVMNIGTWYGVMANGEWYFASDTFEDMGVTFSGWNTNISDYSFNDTAISTFEDDGVTFSVGAKNNQLTNLFSSTPFKSAGVEGAIYKTPRKFTDVYIYVDEFTYGNLSKMYLVLGSEEVETKPTSNIISSTMESFYLYYVKSENDIFVYIDVGYGPMWVNVSMMTELVWGAALPFKGECEKGYEPTDIGYYAYFVPEYLYQVKDSKLQELKYKPKKIEISPNSYEETFKPLKGEYFSEVKLTAGDFITPNKIHHNCTILGVKGACVPVEDFFRNMTFDKIELDSVRLEDKMFYQKRVNEIKIRVDTSYGSINSCNLGERAFSYCEANKIILRGDAKLIFTATTRNGYDKNGNLVEVYNKHQGFYGCSKLTTLVLDFPDFAPITQTNNPDFAVDLFKNTPIMNGTGYIYVPDNKVDYVKTLVGYDQVSSRIRPLSEYVEE